MRKKMLIVMVTVLNRAIREVLTEKLTFEHSPKRNWVVSRYT